MGKLGMVQGVIEVDVHVSGEADVDASSAAVVSDLGDASEAKSQSREVQATEQLWGRTNNMRNIALFAVVVIAVFATVVGVLAYYATHNESLSGPEIESHEHEATFSFSQSSIAPVSASRRADIYSGNVKTVYESAYRTTLNLEATAQVTSSAVKLTTTTATITFVVTVPKESTASAASKALLLTDSTFASAVNNAIKTLGFSASVTTVSASDFTVSPPKLELLPASVKLPFGTVNGTLTKAARKFFSIPYAPKPVRFQAPKAWTEQYTGGVLDATAPRVICHQSYIFLPLLVPGDTNSMMSEDCLVLNVYTPRMRSDAPLPVLVWIHGGGNIVDDASNVVADGANMASEKGMVVVSVNYRLGVWGYSTWKNSDGSVNGNNGYKDQQEALRWVQNHVSAFGGDPKKSYNLGAKLWRRVCCCAFGIPT